MFLKSSTTPPTLQMQRKSIKNIAKISYNALSSCFRERKKKNGEKK